ncbi:MAG: GNAT family N-acetyltransferase [Spirochaetes bacterium]|nr:GNAT family N-acetyltransferase [Spirochaetota bacterium]
MKEIRGIRIRTGLLPGDVGGIVCLHGRLYAEEYGFDCSFEPYVAVPLSEFAVRRHERERIWIVEYRGRVCGSVAIVEHTKSEAQLRWLILHPDLRGHGLGKKLVRDAVSFCKACRYSGIFLWTVDFLDAARRIYESEGFVLTDQKKHRIWGVSLTEQRYERTL